MEIHTKELFLPHFLEAPFFCCLHLNVTQQGCSVSHMLVTWQSHMDRTTLWLWYCGAALYPRDGWNQMKLLFQDKRHQKQLVLVYRVSSPDCVLECYRSLSRLPASSDSPAVQNGTSQSDPASTVGPASKVRCLICSRNAFRAMTLT